MKKSWKTSLFGILAAGGAAAVQSGTLGPKGSSIASLVSYIATALMGLFARDNSVTSEQAGAK